MALFKKDPLKKLRKEYDKKLAEALQFQRNGKIPQYAEKTAEAEEVLAEIKKLEETVNN
ncbi:MAG: Lacal_2735 family protein [Leptospiraceae bacterium]|nr:Lacal_2735 family protein [Leptospiraceae bacterium]MCB1200714.1 Lacal_2735 family protein [Leptospiraceae bacterium]